MNVNNVTISWTTALPSTNYRATVSPVGTAGFATVSKCLFWDVSNKTTTNFRATLRLCDNGVAQVVDTAVALNWIVMADKA